MWYRVVSSRQLQADLRVCASCERIFRRSKHSGGCPYCGFAHYGARWALGPRAYKQEQRQEAWRAKVISSFITRLESLIAEAGAVPVLDIEINGTLSDFLFPDKNKETL